VKALSYLSQHWQALFRGGHQTAYSGMVWVEKHKKIFNLKPNIYD